MLRKLALAGAMVGAVALMALAATPLHTYNNSVGQEQETIGVHCINNTTGEPEACGAGSGGATSANQDTTNSAPIIANAGKATYIVVETGYTAYATPTDLVCLSGSATKTIRITQMYIAMASTSSALQTIYFIKRSTANSGGTSTTPTPIANDSTNAAATAVVRTYTAAPTTGTPVGNIRIQPVASSVLAGTPIAAAVNGTTPAVSAITFSQAITLRGTAQSLCMNYNGAALTSGFTSTYGVEWTEQ